jgi:AraC-like DNA-binding protein
MTQPMLFAWVSHSMKLGADKKGALAAIAHDEEMIAGDLTGTIPLRDIADACELSVSHFSRAFRRSTGLAPHAWLIEARVDRA